jgi:hypothetical protein
MAFLCMKYFGGDLPLLEQLLLHFLIATEEVVGSCALVRNTEDYSTVQEQNV